MNAIREGDVSDWNPTIDVAIRQQAITALEGGCVLCLPNLGFTLFNEEQRFLSVIWSDQKSKNISLRPKGDLRGASGSPEDLIALQAMVGRFADQSAGKDDPKNAGN